MAVLDPTRVGAWTDEVQYTLDANQARAYAAATNDDNPWFTSGRLVPPVYAVALAVPSWVLAMERAFGADPYTLGSVHGEQDLTVYRPLEPGTPVRVRAAVVGVHPRSTGTLVVGRAETRDHDNGLLAEQYFVNFFRGFRMAGGMGEEPPGHRLPDTAGASPPLARVTYPVDMDQGVRYAHASGDMGIYHLDDTAARRLGFPRRIVHGVCTMAFAGRAVVEAVGGDPRRLSRLAVRFSAPLLPGQDVTTTLWSLGQADGATRVGFEVVDRSGVAVITNGLAEVAS